jgi:hypothetical protein
MSGAQVFPATEDEYEGDIRGEHVEPGHSGRVIGG